MGKTLNEIMDALPKQRRMRIEARYRELKEDVESLRALRKAAGKAQSDVAAALKIKQPSVSKIEKQADMYLSTLRSYVEAIGGELDLIIRLPPRRAMRLRQLGDLMSASAKRTRRKPSARSARGRAARRGGARTA